MPIAAMTASASLTTAPAADCPWRRLTGELDRWAAAGRPAALWWRDDDAASPSPALDRLLNLAEAADVPVALAVIPAAATRDLAAALRRRPRVCVLQHGFAHTNHADQSPHARKAELGADRPADAVLAELAEGWRRLSGFKALPVLAPPWNRVAPAVIAGLPAAGFRGLSTFRPRPCREPVPGLIQANTHADIVAWKTGRGFAGTAVVLDAVIAHLSARRLGAADPDEPTGLLTHHRGHDAAGWAFLEQFLAATAAHPAVRWLDAAGIFALEP